MTVQSEGLWVSCQAAIAGKCSKSGLASSAITVTTPGKYAGKVVCAGCAKSLKVKRTSAIATTDTVADRTQLAPEGHRTALKASVHKGQYTRGGALKGTVPLKSDEYQALRTGKAAPKVAAPKATPKAKVAKKRPAPKVA
jgi:hypothetical protein